MNCERLMLLYGLLLYNCCRLQFMIVNLIVIQGEEECKVMVWNSVDVLLLFICGLFMDFVFGCVGICCWGWIGVVFLFCKKVGFIVGICFFLVFFGDLVVCVYSWIFVQGLGLVYLVLGGSQVLC